MIQNLADGGYPPAVAKIIMNKCAVSGCHNDASKDAASGLNLITWDKLFEGTRNGAAVIPYNYQQSTVFLFCNTDTTIGPSIKPTMPVNAPPLSKQEVGVLINWIANGAPNNQSFVKFSDIKQRAKYYVSNQGCDLLTVFDAATDLPMRSFNVGQSSGRIESPHQVKISPDGQYYYVILLTGTVIQKFRASDDSFMNEVYIGQGSWNTFVITQDGSTAFSVDYSAGDGNFQGQGRVYCINLSTMEIKAKYQGDNLFAYPHAVALNKTNDVLYLFGQEASFFYKIDMRAPLYSQTDPGIGSLTQMDQSPAGILLKPHDVLFSATGDKYFVTCQNANQVRVYNTADDHLIKAIDVGAFPQEFALSSSTDNLFVTCMEDTSSFPGKRGSVAVINTASLTVVKTIFSGFQPHGVAIDEARKKVIITNRNINNKGPAPHHVSDCGGRNGYVTYIDLNTLELIPGKKVEVSIDPYFVSMRP